jgi:microsomal epoxide hydrolase
MSQEEIKAQQASPEFYLSKPMGYSWFPKELVPTPVAWVRKVDNLVWFKRHEQVQSVLE